MQVDNSGAGHNSFRRSSFSAMAIGESILRQIELRPGLTQDEVARRAGIQPATLSKIINNKTKHPRQETIDKILTAIGASHADVYGEPQFQLSPEDAEIASRAHEWIGRMLKNHAAQRDLLLPREPAKIRDTSGRNELSGDVENSTQRIPESHQRLDARRAFRVRTDAMIKAGILEDSVIFVRPTADRDSADGEIVVCRLGKRLFLRRLDRRGGRTVLTAENPRYDPIHVGPDEKFEMIGVVVRPPKRKVKRP